MKSLLLVLLVLGLTTAAAFAQAPCPTTLDGLPMCARNPTLTAADCLAVYPPDLVGSFCVYHGYATTAEEDTFEQARGFHRVKHNNGTGDTFAAGVVPPSRLKATLQRIGHAVKTTTGLILVTGLAILVCSQGACGS